MTSLVQARIRARRAIKPTSKRIPKQPHPLNIEREYARTLRGMMVMVNAMTQAEVAKLFGRQDGKKLIFRILRRDPEHVIDPAEPALGEWYVMQTSATLENAQARIAQVEKRLGKKIETRIIDITKTDIPIRGSFVDATLTSAEAIAALPSLPSVGILPELKPVESVVVNTINVLRFEVERQFTSTRMGLIAQGAGDRTNKFNRVAVGDQIKAVIGIDPLGTVEKHSGSIAPILEDFVTENVSLIKAISSRYLDEVGSIVQDAVYTGKRADEVSGLVQGRFDVSQSRADLIARDQISKLNGQLTQTRQGSLGISRYIWRTSLDERVRDTHAALEGKLIDWNSPPRVGHPGEDFQCRCRAEPDLSDLLGE